MSIDMLLYLKRLSNRHRTAYQRNKAFEYAHVGNQSRRTPGCLNQLEDQRRQLVLGMANLYSLPVGPCPVFNYVDAARPKKRKKKLEACLRWPIQVRGIVDHQINRPHEFIRDYSSQSFFVGLVCSPISLYTRSNAF